MKKFLAIIAIASFVACNNDSDTKNTTVDSTKVDTTKMMTTPVTPDTTKMNTMTDTSKMKSSTDTSKSKMKKK